MEAAFPREGEFKIHSHPIFLLESEDGEQSEMLVFDANMVIGTGEPHVAAHKRRRVDVEVREWRAVAYSQLLDGEIELRLGARDQPKSHVTATSGKADLPGRLEFNMDWDLLVNGEVALQGLEGRATGRIRRFPPKGDVFQIQGKEVVVGNFSVNAIACACVALPFSGRMPNA